MLSPNRLAQTTAQIRDWLSRNSALLDAGRLVTISASCRGDYARRLVVCVIKSLKPDSDEWAKALQAAAKADYMSAAIVMRKLNPW